MKGLFENVQELETIDLQRSIRTGKISHCAFSAEKNPLISSLIATEGKSPAAVLPDHIGLNHCL
ncbi:MAG: hypothetical protein ABL994_25085 [Verrucomicrobiales bacterium]